MSYEIVRSLSLKNKTITSAANNVRPLDFSKWNVKHKDGTAFSDDEFILFIIDNTLDGNFHFMYRDNKYNVIANQIREDNGYKILHELVWNFDRNLPEQYHHDNYEQIHTLYLNYLKVKIEEIMSGKKYVKIRSAIISDYNINYDVLVDFNNESIYLGKRENYDNAGTYDNSDNSLIYCGNDSRLFRALSSKDYQTYDNDFRNKCVELLNKIS